MTFEVSSFHVPRRPESERKQHLMALHSTMVAYLQAKVTDADWHGVADAAMDLREIEAELRGLRSGD